VGKPFENVGIHSFTFVQIIYSQDTLLTHSPNVRVTNKNNHLGEKNIITTIARA